jgi:hypothetical protein
MVSALAPFGVRSCFAFQMARAYSVLVVGPFGGAPGAHGTVQAFIAIQIAKIFLRVLIELGHATRTAEHVLTALMRETVWPFAGYLHAADRVLEGSGVALGPTARYMLVIHVGHDG